MNGARGWPWAWARQPQKRQVWSLHSVLTETQLIIIWRFICDDRHWLRWVVLHSYQTPSKNFSWDLHTSLFIISSNLRTKLLTLLKDFPIFKPQDVSFLSICAEAGFGLQNGKGKHLVFHLVFLVALTGYILSQKEHWQPSLSLSTSKRNYKHLANGNKQIHTWIGPTQPQSSLLHPHELYDLWPWRYLSFDQAELRKLQVAPRVCVACYTGCELRIISCT